MIKTDKVKYSVTIIDYGKKDQILAKLTVISVYVLESRTYGEILKTAFEMVPLFISVIAFS